MLAYKSSAVSVKSPFPFVPTAERRRPMLPDGVWRVYAISR